MSLKDEFADLVNRQYETLMSRGGEVVTELIEGDTVNTIESFFGDISAVIDKYGRPTESSVEGAVESTVEAAGQASVADKVSPPADANYVDADFFTMKPKKVARELIGATIYSGGKSAVISQTGAYEGHASRKLKGLEYGPGNLFQMVSRGGKKNLCINTEKQEVASVVTIRELTLPDGSKLSSSEIAGYLGLSKPNDDDKTFSDAGIQIALNPGKHTFISKANAPKYSLPTPNNVTGYYQIK